MEKDTEITICLGSSCFVRGNNETLKVIKEYLKNNKLENKVYFHGNHCFAKCSEGPILKINDKIYRNVNKFNVIEILTEYFYNK
jgi:NADH:ubiquinone oxidoreductase subunit E